MVNFKEENLHHQEQIFLFSGRPLLVIIPGVLVFVRDRACGLCAKARGLSLRTGAQTMLYLACTTISRVGLAHYGVSSAKDWISLDCGINHALSLLYRDIQCRPCTLRSISC